MGSTYPNYTAPTWHSASGPGDSSPEDDEDLERRRRKRDERQEREIDRLHYGWRDQ